MAMNYKLSSVLHHFVSPVGTFLYLAYQQDKFQVDLEQVDEDGDSVFEGMLRTMLSSSPNLDHYNLHLIKYIFEVGRVQDTPWLLIYSICACIRSITTNTRYCSAFSKPKTSEIDDLMTWLANLLATIHWSLRCRYLLLLVTHDYYSRRDKPGDYPALNIGVDRTPTICLWFDILRKANISLHEFFRDMEEYLQDNKIPDFRFHRQGIESGP